MAMTLVPGFQTNLLLAWDAKLNFQESTLFAGKSRGSDAAGVQLAIGAIAPGRRSRKVSPPIRVSGVLKLAMPEEEAMITAIALHDQHQDMGGHSLTTAAMKRSCSEAALEDKVRAAFQHRDSSSPDRGAGSCLNRSASQSETDKFLLGDSIGSLRGFSGLCMDSMREEEISERVEEKEDFSAAAPNFQVEEQIVTKHENSRSSSFPARPPRGKKLPTTIKKGTLIEAFSNFPHRERNGEIYSNRVEGLQSRVFPHSRKVTKFCRLSVGRQNAASMTIGIFQLAKAKRKESETAVRHGIAINPLVDFINLKINPLGAKRCKGRLPTSSMSTTSTIVSATTDQYYIENHNENIPLIAGAVQEMTFRRPARNFVVPAYVRVKTRKNVTRIPRAVIQDDDIITVEDAGEPNIPCDSCKGKGWLVCDFCEGQKVNVQSPRNNRIYRRCPNCRAVGVVICPRCKVFKCVSCPDEKDTDVTL